MPVTLTREQLKAMLEAKERFTLIDVRSAESHQAQHIPGAINMPVDEIEAVAPGRLALDDQIVVYCASFECNASPTAAAALEDLGYTNVADFEGGLVRLRRACPPPAGWRTGRRRDTQPRHGSLSGAIEGGDRCL